MRKLLLGSVFLLGLTDMAVAAPVSYELIKEKSQLKFVAIQNNAPVTGMFKEFDAEISFDYTRPQDGKIKATIKTGSVTTDYEEVEKNLKLPEWLAVEMFPEAKLETTLISQIPSSNNYYAEGKLTLRDKTMPIVLNFQIKDFGDTAIAEGYATVKRSDYGVGQGEWANADVVKNEVRVEFRINAKKIN